MVWGHLPFQGDGSWGCFFAASPRLQGVGFSWCFFFLGGCCVSWPVTLGVQEGFLQGERVSFKVCLGNLAKDGLYHDAQTFQLSGSAPGLQVIVSPTQGLPGSGRPLCSACFDCRIFLGWFLIFSNTSRGNSQLLSILLRHPSPETDLPVGRGTQGLRQWVLTDCTDMLNSKGHYSPWKFVRIGLPERSEICVPF